MKDNRRVVSEWWKDLCDGPSLVEIAKKREFEINNDLKFHYRYLEQYEKERNLSDAERADKRNLEILKKW